MKKLICCLLSLCLLVLLCACSRTLPEATPTSAVTAAPDATASPAPEAEPEEPAPSPAAPVPTPSVDWQGLYTAYLGENFAALTAGCYGFISGVGFVDLDLDTVPELLIFDAGAASSMGVQFFDIVDGAVYCVSASSVDVGETLGGAYYDPALNVNTTDFQSFRLVEAANGDLYFQVVSYNGAEDFNYNELLRFGSDNGVLRLTTVACRQSFLNPQTQTMYTIYTQGDTPIDEGAYNAILEQAYTAVDLGYEAMGVFEWESDGYGRDWEGFSAMLDAAVAGYVPAV